MARHLLRGWREVAPRIRSAGRLVVLLDFDGTLTPLQERADTVALGANMRHALRRLVRHRRVRAAIVSGRRRAYLVSHVRVRRLQYWGLFGWERRRGRSLPAPVRGAVTRARADVIAGVEGLAGIWIEDKEFGFSVHFRAASTATVRCARLRMRSVLRRHRPTLHVTEGAMVWNVFPSQVPDKGTSVLQALARVPTPFVSIYVGDDATDERAFAALKGAITVRVGPSGHTHASYRVADPAEVHRFLELLDAELSDAID